MSNELFEARYFRRSAPAGSSWLAQQMKPVNHTQNMPLIATGRGGGSDRPLIKAGTHVARCYSVIDLGTQPPHPNAQYPKDKHRVMFQWEIPGQTWEFDGETLPLACSKEFTLSLHEKSDLKPFLENWRAKTFTPEEIDAFDILKVAGAYCMLSIVHEQKRDGSGPYARVAGAVEMPKEIARPEPVNNVFTYELDQGRDDIYASLPEWIQRKIAQCREWNQSPSIHDDHDPEPVAATVTEDEADKLPF